MTTRSIGEILANAAPAKQRRTFQPVRRNSYQAGQREKRHWVPIGSSNREARKLIALRLKAAEQFDRQEKQPGSRNGPLGHIGIEVLRALYSIVNFKTGRLDPSIDHICSKIKRSRAAVVAALARLRQHGFLNWIRRTEKVENDGPGPQVKQISNAYWFSMPAKFAAWVKRKMEPAPAPEDDNARREAEAAAVKQMLNDEGYSAIAQYYAPDSSTGSILNRIGQQLDFNASSLSGQNSDPL